jgi:hypothetical protein
MKKAPHAWLMAAARRLSKAKLALIRYGWILHGIGYVSH